MPTDMMQEIYVVVVLSAALVRGLHSGSLVSIFDLAQVLRWIPVLIQPSHFIRA